MLVLLVLVLALSLPTTSPRIVKKHSHHHHQHHHHSHHHPLQPHEFGPFTDDFLDFLRRHNDHYQYVLDVYANYGPTGSFGGKHPGHQIANRVPVLFIHGNSDSALDFGAPDGSNSGWNRQLAYFTSRGYTTADLYGMTYGDRTLAHSFLRSINCDDLVGHRKFAEAILEYTGSYALNVVAHSMGVTYARALIQGGRYFLNGKMCDLGDSLVDRIDTLIAISSANYGMCLCANHSNFPACNASVGYFPGKCSRDLKCEEAYECDDFSEGYSSVLRGLNENGKDAAFVFSLWSSGDQIVGTGGNLVHGRQTSLVPHSDMNIHFSGLTHFEMKTETVSQQYYLLKHHTLPRSMYNNSAELF